jgi:hypothetical protein
MGSRGGTRRWLLPPVLFFTFVSCGSRAATSGTVPFVLDGNRVYAQLAFIRPDGTYREVMAFVDLGSPSMIMSPELFEELHLGQRNPLAMRVGTLTVSISASSVAADSWFPFSISGNRRIEALLPAGALLGYEVVIDYAHRTLTLAQPGTLQPEGTPVPFQVNNKTGLIAVDVTIDHESYPITVDNGSAYTWVRKAIAQKWLNAHPDWQRGVGAVGASNMRMADDEIETKGIILRIPEISLGGLRLREIGALAIGPSNTNWDFMDWYSQKNPVPTIGWLGANVLQGFRITIDYSKHISYWLAQSPLDPHDLEQVGLTLTRKRDGYFVAAIATQNGKPTVDNVQAGDKLVRIGDLPADSASFGAVFMALHGKPGETRILHLERNGRQFTARARVTSF